MPLITRLGALLTTMVLVGCGSPPPDPPVASEARGSTGVIHSAPVDDAPTTSVTGQLQAMEVREEQLSDEIELVAYRLVDEDEQVFAQELWEEQFIQEAETDTP